VLIGDHEPADPRVTHSTKCVVAEALVVSLGGLVFGYDLGAISSATQSLRSQFHLSPRLFGITISFSLWGTVFGSLLAGRWADRVERRTLVACCAVIYGLAAIGATLPVMSDWASLLAVRFLCWTAIGGFTVGCPLYLAELSPVALRGRLVSLFQVQVGVGVVVAFAAASLFVHLGVQGQLWRWCLGGGVLPSMVLVFLLRSLPRTRIVVAKELSVIEHAQPVESAMIGKERDRRLFRRRNIRPILLATSIALFNQLSGVNILLLYVLDVLSSAGIGLETGRRYTILISSLGLGTTLLGMSSVDKFGRKVLLYIGSAGMAVCLLSLAVAIPHHLVSWVYLSMLVAYNVFFAFSQGTVVWVYLSELFPIGVRGAGQGYGSFVHWVANAMLVLVFPVVQHASSARIFYVFAIFMAVQMAVIWFWYPETRGAALGANAVADNGRDSTRVP
jgi:MFS transporter, SP family, arabinose:H+ symporter